MELDIDTDVRQMLIFQAESGIDNVTDRDAQMGDLAFLDLLVQAGEDWLNQFFEIMKNYGIMVGGVQELTEQINNENGYARSDLGMTVHVSQLVLRDRLLPKLENT